MGSLLIERGLAPERLRAARVIVWKGNCSVHQRFLPEHVDKARAKYRGIRVIAQPECRWEVCQKADAVGSREGLLKMIREAPAGAMFAVGTEIHLVNRMGKEFAAEGKKIITLDDSGCLCTTMFRISPQHLCWVLENLVARWQQARGGGYRPTTTRRIPGARESTPLLCRLLCYLQLARPAYQLFQFALDRRVADALVL